MKFSSYREIVDNYAFLEDIVKKLDDDEFLYMTTEEIQKEKIEIIEGLSKRYRLLCTELRRRNKLYDKPIETISKRVRFEDIVETIKNHFKEIGSALHKECSQIKGHIQFRNWYAHGRYFFHSPVIPDPEDLEMIFSTVDDVVLDR